MKAVVITADGLKIQDVPRPDPMRSWFVSAPPALTVLRAG